MTKHIATPDTAQAPDHSQRMSRKQFNGYLYELYGCTGGSDVTPHYVYGGDEDNDYHVEIYLNSPAGGMILAVHHGPELDLVDVLSFRGGMVPELIETT
ncbi:hypothetical protein [Phaeobacter inhibens]|uniref:hypothetical protein n=1 Tax=Phaeobacter inhibens TaxID=221822 RepID=UPI0021A7BD13|nr:hypothetical protein [Phaeobacter inhibens]UWR59103.1 hypothetical protein K4F88_09075 [Phaeobacter inhibens]